MGRMKSPTRVFLKPPHFPRKRTAFGATADSRSMTVAAMALPMPKLRMVTSPAVADCMGRSRPRTGTLKRSANRST